VFSKSSQRAVGLASVRLFREGVHENVYEGVIMVRVKADLKGLKGVLDVGASEDFLDLVVVFGEVCDGSEGVGDGFREIF